MNSSQARPGPGRPPSIDKPLRTICDAAAVLIAERGYDGTSLKDVADSVGMTKAGLYHYFPSKQALFDAIILSTLEELYQSATTAIYAVSDHREKLVAFMSAHASYFDLYRDKYRASFFGQAGGNFLNYSGDQLEARRRYVQLLEAILATGVQRGELEVPDVATFARGVLGMLNWMSRWYRPDGRLSASQIAESYARALLSGIDAKGPIRHTPPETGQALSD